MRWRWSWCALVVVSGCTTEAPRDPNAPETPVEAMLRIRRQARADDWGFVYDRISNASRPALKDHLLLLRNQTLLLGRDYEKRKVERAPYRELFAYYCTTGDIRYLSFETAEPGPIQGDEAEVIVTRGEQKLSIAMRREDGVWKVVQPDEITADRLIPEEHRDR